ncbi:MULTISPECIES: hypothetical protein [Streptomyces]|nr:MULTISPECIES: hypothetical protein [Streptomyces]MBP5865283.1 hypothetical protein [Streptomyces sp. LBUM 1484]MBP5872249.1 hypothetical protein [Streptomyces sp. LBUM 1485]MBP5909855.1 hypothetical protein [Streptomyces sp. LBUM 1478]MBP5933345.1 hypothetical protein [Streptomyces sp. LBUM 1479]KFG05448.1 hypothetical protein IQ61_30310 [Streptomyces scabiei]
MDLEGIGAVSAAVVALLGIGGALLVGRWQMRGAVRQAEETARAGLKQAEATYRAALDAVHAESSAAFHQWRRGMQREAAHALLLACDQVDAAGERLKEAARVDPHSPSHAQGEIELADAMHALRSATFAVELEGPQPVYLEAARYSTDTTTRGDWTKKEVRRIRALACLEKHRLDATEAFEADNNGDGPPLESLPGYEVWKAFQLLMMAAKYHPDQVERDSSATFRPCGEDVRSAYGRFYAAVHALPNSDPVHQHARILYQTGLRSTEFQVPGDGGHTPSELVLRDILNGQEDARTAFIAAARAELARPFHHLAP